MGGNEFFSEPLRAKRHCSPELASLASECLPFVSERSFRGRRTRQPSGIALSPSCSWGCLLGAMAELASACPSIAVDIEHPALWQRRIQLRPRKQTPCIRPSTNRAPGNEWKCQSKLLLQFVAVLTFTYATGGISAPVNIVTSVSMQVTRSVTRPGMASRPSQKLNQLSMTTSDDGANVWMRWWPGKVQSWVDIRRFCGSRLTNLPLKSKVYRQPRVVSVFLGHVAVGFLQMQWRSQVVLQQFQFRIDVHAILSPFQPDLRVAVREALDVDRTNLNVHGIELELHLTSYDCMQARGITNCLVFVKRHGWEFVGQRGDFLKDEDEEHENSINGRIKTVLKAFFFVLSYIRINFDDTKITISR